MNLLQMSFTGAVMILAVTVIRALAINKVPKKTFLVLWGIALVRLMIPFSLPSWFSIYSCAGIHNKTGLFGLAVQNGGFEISYFKPPFSF